MIKGIDSEWINWEIFGQLGENETLYLSQMFGQCRIETFPLMEKIKKVLVDSGFEKGTSEYFI
jgi:hypothetical protein